MLETKVKWWAYKTEWGRVEGTGEAIINSAKILNFQHKKINSLKPGEDFIVKVDYIVKEKVKDPHFGVAIFREDGVYCYGPNTLFDNYRIDYLNEGIGWFEIRYKDIPLLPGNYRLSIAIWDKKEILAYNYHSGLYRFKIIGINLNNQLFNMRYKWDDKAQGSFSGSEHMLSLESLKNIWRKSLKYENDVYIKEIGILNINNKPESCFKTDEALKLKICISDIDANKCLLWVGIFREDGVYCHGAFKKLEKNEKEVFLTYPRILLLNGDYLISAGLFNIKRNKIITCNHGLYPFKIFSNLKDHGTVYCEHEWKWELS